MAYPKILPLRPVPTEPSGLSPCELDALLVRRAQGGDGQAWARLYQRHFDAMYRDALFMVQQPVVAEDLVQEAFAAALVALHRFDGRGNVRAWLRGIVQNLVRKHWRSLRRPGRAYERVARGGGHLGPPVIDDPESSHVRDSRAQILSDVMQTLPDTLREVFVLRDVQALSVAEVSERLDLSPGNVRVRANRARRRIRDELRKLGLLEEGES